MSPRSIGLFVGLTAAAVTLVLWNRSDGDAFGGNELDAAKMRWNDNRPDDYDLVVVTKGARPARHEIKVRGRRVVSRTTDGREVAVRLLGTWTVSGMFETIGLELNNQAQAQRVYGVTGPDDVTLNADFDKKYGYPRVFLRHVHGQKRSIEWKVESFTPR